MNIRIFALVAACFFVVAVSGHASAAEYADCKTLTNGITACGQVTDGLCGTGSGSGEATGSVHWRLEVLTNHGNAYDEAYGPAAALAANAGCGTNTCTTVVLYANGEFLVSSVTLCW